ncbi:MAG: peptide deformylase [Anaerolineaceae bacterium]|nr:peptide deformylase [Anaerolineaceae bacterium]MBN2678220.1 peptide deformylase [Anaerolineaceae bacterium]
MSLRTIITLPDSILRRKSHKVTSYDREFQTLVDDMIETMREAPGVGLAAPQIAVPYRLIVVEFGDEENEEKPKKLFVVANPELSQHSEEKVTAIEACLSVPGLVGEVERHEQVIVRGMNRFGKPVKIKARGWLARIFQHETDHVDGILYVDRASRVWQPTEEEAQVIAD